MGAGRVPLRVAFLGCGFAARLHARALRGLGDDVRCFFASRDAARAQAFASELGGKGSFHGYEPALASSEIDVVVVLTPPPQHLEWTLRGLRAGKHVVVEKPPFLHASDFDVVEEAAQRAGRRVLVAENYHDKPLVRSLRRLLAEGAIGPVRYVFVNALKEQRATGWRASRAEAGGGALFEGGIHWVDFMASLGLSPRTAHGFAPAHDMAPERDMLVVFEFAEGAVGALAHSWDTPSPLRGLRLSRIYGRDGSIVFESNGLFVAVWGRRPRLLIPGLLRDLTGRVAMWRDFVAALVSGRETELSLVQARRDLELVEEAYASLGQAARRET